MNDQPINPLLDPHYPFGKRQEQQFVTEADVAALEAAERKRQRKAAKRAQQLNKDEA